MSKYTILRDSREHDFHGWIFPKDEFCDGTVEVKLPTGDYTIEGYDKRFTIERKGSMGEFAANLVEKRFERELARLDLIQHAFIVLEFEFAQFINFPEGSGIPAHKWGRLRLTPKFLVHRLNEIQLQHRAQIVFVGRHGMEFCASLFKRILACK